MSALERRLQLLLDQARYDRVATEAEQSGRSVAAVIREAIDLRFPSGDDVRAAALEEFLAMTAAADERPESWPQIKHALETQLDEALPR